MSRLVLVSVGLGLVWACGGGGDGSDQDGATGEAGAQSSSAGEGSANAGTGGTDGSAGEGSGGTVSGGASGMTSTGGSAGVAGTSGSTGVQQTGAVPIPLETFYTLAAAPDRSVVLKLSEAPWLLRLRPDEPEPQPIQVRAALDWAGRMIVAQDGTLFFAGYLSPTEVQVQQLSAEGELLSSARVPGSPLVGLAQATDGGVRVAVVSSGDVRVHRIEGETAVQEAGIDGLLLPLDFEPAIAHFAMHDPASFAVGHVDDPFFITNGGQLIELGNSLWTRLGGVTSDRAGGWFVTWSEPEGGDLFSVTLDRYRSDGSTIWSHRLPLTGNEFAELAYQSSGVVALADSTVFTFFSALETQGGNVAPAAVRVGMDGSRLDAFPSLTSVDWAGKTGDHEVVLMSRRAGQFVWVSFPAAPPPNLADGSACGTSDVCESGNCCFDARTNAGTCASQGCGFANRCAADLDCAEGFCALPGPPAMTGGYCGAECTQSGDCPLESYCVEGSCLPVCSGTCSIRGTSCRDRDNAEGILVSVCVFDIAATP